jgi:hypothetical protein
MTWPGWRNVSVRKPLAVASFVLAGGLCAASFTLGRDLPPNAADALKWLVAVAVGGYAGTSAWETVKRREKNDGNDG